MRIEGAPVLQSRGHGSGQLLVVARTEERHQGALIGRQDPTTSENLPGLETYLMEVDEDDDAVLALATDVGTDGATMLVSEIA